MQNASTRKTENRKHLNLSTNVTTKSAQANTRVYVHSFTHLIPICPEQAEQL